MGYFWIIILGLGHLKKIVLEKKNWIFLASFWMILGLWWVTNNNINGNRPWMPWIP